MNETATIVVPPQPRWRLFTRLDVAVLLAALVLAGMIAVPRHVNLARDARQAEVGVLLENISGAAELAHSMWVASGEPAAMPGTRGMVAMVNGYPSVATLPLMLETPEAASFDYLRGRWQHLEVAENRECGVRYTPPAALGELPTIEAALDGC